MVKQRILEDLRKTTGDLGYQVSDIVLSISKNPQFGDYTTNIALQLAKQKSQLTKQTPQDIANQIIDRVQGTDGSGEYLEKIEVAGAGFINFFVSDKYLIKNLKTAGDLSKDKTKGKILVEYGHTNPLKEIHIGHLRTFILGESIARILESLGHQVFRANYQGDIGVHIAKAIWGVEKMGLPTKELNLEEKAEFLGKCYAEGNTAYETDPTFKSGIDRINAQLYQKQPQVKKIYELTRSWSLEYFEPIYQVLGIKYDRCFFESEVFEEGKKIVLENIGKVFEENEGAVIFPGRKYDLQTRVFITSADHPTYEGKEMGLAKLEYETFNYNNSLHVVASEQEGYFQVIIKAIDLVFPHLKGKKQHLSYGMVDIKEGKMSSRTGNVITVDDLISIVSEKVREVMKKNRLNIDQAVVKKVALGAIKFSYLKYSPRPNIVFDLDQSVSLEGDSGPYIQYTYARIHSVLNKANKKLDEVNFENIILDRQESSLLRQLIYFPEVVQEAAAVYHPNLIANYLLQLSRLFNLFYQENRIIGSEKEDFRLYLSFKVGEVLEKGLNLLGIEAPERM